MLNHVVLLAVMLATVEIEKLLQGKNVAILKKRRKSMSSM